MLTSLRHVTRWGLRALAFQRKQHPFGFDERSFMGHSRRQGDDDSVVTRCSLTGCVGLCRKEGVSAREDTWSSMVGKGLVCGHLWGTSFWGLQGDGVAGQEGRGSE